MPDEVVIIGCGPGVRDYLLPVAVEAVAGVDVLAGAGRLLELFPDFCGKRLSLAGADVEGFLREVARLPGRVGVLVSGDPNLYSLAGRVLDFFGDANCRIIPGISSVDIALCRLNLLRQNVRIVSAHSPHCPDIKENPPLLQAGESLIMLAGNVQNNLEIIRYSQKLAEITSANRLDIFVLKDLTLKDECIKQLALERLEAHLQPGRVMLAFCARA